MEKLNKFLIDLFSLIFIIPFALLTFLFTVVFTIVYSFIILIFTIGEFLIESIQEIFKERK